MTVADVLGERGTAGVTRGTAVRQALLLFAAAGTVLGLLLAVAMVLVVRHADQEQALDRADRLAETLANEVVGPAFDSADRDREQALELLLGSRAQDGSIVRIKVWTPEGLVLWADDPRLIGRRYELAPEDQALLGTREAYAALTDLRRPENEYETGLPGSYIEVYAGFFDNGGNPLLFEAYLPAGELGAGLWRADLIGLSLGWLVLLLVVVLPLAASLARRIERAQGEQQRLLRHAMQASELERRRLAQDLHDGVIQDLAGVGYVFAALEGQLTDSSAALATAQRASSIVRRDVTALRALSTDLYPPDLGGEGLQSAVEEMLGQCHQDGLETELHLDDRLALPPHTALVAYRVVREALRNIVKHAQASHVVVEVRRSADHVVVRVEDDGRGFDVSASPPEGHLGLRVLRDSVTDVRGELDLTSSAVFGTRLQVRLPVT